MKIFLVLLITLWFAVSCSDINVEEDPYRQNKTDRNGDSEEDDAEEEDSKWNIGSAVKNVCKNKDYTIFSYGECFDKNNISFSINPVNPINANKKPVDILFIVDSSNSMYSYLNLKSGFKKRFKNFIPTIDKELAWRIMFTNAGHYDGGFFAFFANGNAQNGKAMRLEGKYGLMRKQYYLHNQIPDYLNVFHYTMTADPQRIDHDGESHDECQYPPYCQGTEKPLSALKASFSANKDFTRDEADLVAIIISNTDEPEETKVTAEKVVSEFENVYGSNKRLITLSLIVLPDDKKCRTENDNQQFLFKETKEGKKIAELARQTGGGNFSICLKDYSSILAETIIRLTQQ